VAAAATPRLPRVIKSQAVKGKADKAGAKRVCAAGVAAERD